MTTTDDLAALLLRRRQSVYVPSGAGRSAVTEAAVVVLEAELADRGHVLTAPLRRALTDLPAGELAATGMRLLADVDALLGSDRRHVPLFARFPEEIPYQHAYDRYTSLVVAHLAAQPYQPCMNCAGTKARVRALAPCAHLVCDDCHGVAWDWGCCDDCCVWYACPICEKRYETDGPTDPWIDTGDTPAGDGGDILRALRLGAPGDEAAELAALLARRTPLNPQDHDDLVLLLARAHTGGVRTGGAHADGVHADGGASGDLGWLPDEIPLRESKALALAPLLDDPATRPLVARYANTATDVLRLLVVRSGGDPDLLELPRLRRVSRPVRRELLRLLDSFGLDSLCEDFARYPGAWKRVGEVLHPFEGGVRAGRHPRAALAFAVLRGTRLDDPALTEVLLAEAARHDDIRLDGDRLRHVGWQGRVEAALGRWDTTAATALLRARPGELLRRLDVLLARSGEEALPEVVGEALAHALPRVGVGPLLGAYGRMKVRAEPGARRVFFPRGRVTKGYAVEDHRPPLPSRVAARAAELIEAEAVRRLGVGPVRSGEPYDIAVLDASLVDLPVPFAERASAVSLVSVPRGSSLPMPGAGERVRLFLHWQQPKGVRVDLDLSVAMFDDAWRFVGLCDYTQLEYAGGAAVHSGDLTSAPAPHGATEYLDLDLPRLTKAGVRFVVPAVLSYNNVPFDELPDAFAGFMAVDPARQERVRYDPRTVRQRFDLAGEAALRVPMIVDLRSRRAWWADLTLATGDGNHSVWRHRAALARAGHDLVDTFTAGGRATLWDLACWTAAARTDGDVLVRGRGHVLWGYRREEDEPRADFAVRIRDGWEPDVLCAEPELADRRALVALVHGDLAGAERAASGTAYRLFPGPLDEAPLTRVTASDLAGWLAPGR